MTVLSVRDLSVQLGGRPVLHDVTFAMGSGELVGLLGPNGAGKTTLLRSLLGLVRRTSGQVDYVEAPHCVRGADSDCADTPARRHAKPGYVPQRHEFAWHYPITVLDAVINARVGMSSWFRGTQRADMAAALDALDRVDLVHLRRRPVGELSGGQRQRVLMARALAVQATILFLDEPFTGLDLPTQEMLAQLFQELAADGESLLVSTHDLVSARVACDRIILLNRTIIADGHPTELNDPHLWSTTFGVNPDSALLETVGLQRC